MARSVFSKQKYQEKFFVHAGVSRKVLWCRGSEEKSVMSYIARRDKTSVFGMPNSYQRAREKYYGHFWPDLEVFLTSAINFPYFFHCICPFSQPICLLSLTIPPSVPYGLSPYKTLLSVIFYDKIFTGDRAIYPTTIRIQFEDMQ